MAKPCYHVGPRPDFDRCSKESELKIGLGISRKNKTITRTEILTGFFVKYDVLRLT